MKAFHEMEIMEAERHATEGGQALHLHGIIVNRATAPNCFKRAVDGGMVIAHLFDNDRPRLVRTARRLGVRVIKVDRDGVEGQHVDLCGRPLVKALLECENIEPDFVKYAMK